MGQSETTGPAGSGLSADVGTVMITLASAGPKLVRLNLSGNRLGSHAASAIATAVSARAARGCPLEVLGLGSTGLGNAACEALSKPVAEGSLKLLDLSSCEITDHGIGLLALGLQAQSCRLEELRLSGNCLDGNDQHSEGASRLGRVLAWRCCTAAAHAAAAHSAGSGVAGEGHDTLALAARAAIPRLLEMGGASMAGTVTAASAAAVSELAQTRSAIARGAVTVPNDRDDDDGGGYDDGEQLSVPALSAGPIVAAAEAALSVLGFHAAAPLSRVSPWQHPPPRTSASSRAHMEESASPGHSDMRLLLTELADRVEMAEARAAQAEEKAAEALLQAAALREEMRDLASGAVNDVSDVSAAVDRLSAQMGRVDAMARRALAAVTIPEPEQAGRRGEHEPGRDTGVEPAADEDASSPPAAQEAGVSRIANAIAAATVTAQSAKRTAEAAQVEVRSVNADTLRREVSGLRERFDVLEEAVMREQADTIAALEAILNMQERHASAQ
jgi:hypothetical protein